MENKYNDSNNCDQCSADFQNEVNELVDNVENYTQEDHLKKEQEVDSAFGSQEKSNQGCGCGSGK